VSVISSAFLLPVLSPRVELGALEVMVYGEPVDLPSGKARSWGSISRGGSPGLGQPDRATLGRWRRGRRDDGADVAVGRLV
jgi:hypothetical protein